MTLATDGEIWKAVITDPVRDLGGFPLKRIVPCHCTGWRALRALSTDYMEDVQMPAAVGRKFAP